jgi:hypothetical protein
MSVSLGDTLNDPNPCSIAGDIAIFVGGIPEKIVILYLHQFCTELGDLTRCWNAWRTPSGVSMQIDTKMGAGGRGAGMCWQGGEVSGHTVFQGYPGAEASFEYCKGATRAQNQVPIKPVHFGIQAGGQG